MKKSAVITIAVVVLVLIGGVIAWAVTRSAEDDKKSQTVSKEEQPTEEESQPFDASEFTTDKKEKKITGEVHSILDMGLSYTANYDRVTFAFASNAANQSPGYIAELKDKVIWIRFLDTRDVDMDMQKVYEGESTVTGEGQVIEKAEIWYPRDDSSIGAKIYLNEARGFRVTDDGLFITLDVDCGCGS